jgi:uncharacterized membrane protein YeaQ/YmgE (transglycosylase-associated protein family)
MVIRIILLIIIAAVCGSVGMSLTGYNKKGCLASIAVGFIGAILGTYLAGLLDLPMLLTFKVGGANFPIIWAIIGAVVFSLPLSLLFGGRK